MQRQKFRALIDSGTACSLINQWVYDKMANQPKLDKKDKITLQSVSGGDIVISGKINVEFYIGCEKVKHDFYVARNINKNISLGRTFLTENGVWLYYDFNSLSIGRSYVKLEQNILSGL